MRTTVLVLSCMLSACDGTTSEPLDDAGGASSRDAARVRDASASDRGRPDAGRDPDAPLPDAGESTECVRPTELTTGVPAGIALTPSGDVRVTEDGAVIERLDIDGDVEVAADGVVIRASRIRGRVALGDSRDTLIEDCEIGPDDGYGGAEGINGSHFVARRVNIHNFQNGMRIGTSAIVERSYVHHPWAGAGDAHEGGGINAWMPYGPGTIRIYCSELDVSVPAAGGPEGLGNDAFEMLGQEGPDVRRPRARPQLVQRRHLYRLHPRPLGLDLGHRQSLEPLGLLRSAPLRRHVRRRARLGGQRLRGRHPDRALARDRHRPTSISTADSRATARNAGRRPRLTSIVRVA